jgi:hypothetical protein
VTITGGSIWVLPLEAALAAALDAAGVELDEPDEDEHPARTPTPRRATTPTTATRRMLMLICSLGDSGGYD